LAGTIQSFVANPSRVQQGANTTLTWHTTNMNSCSVIATPGGTVAGSNLNGDPQPASVSPQVNQKTIFTLTCTDINGDPKSSSVTISVVPITKEQ
jgi:FtsP/CotA-like multicopper oxidase with cupredoxin domain